MPNCTCSNRRDDPPPCPYCQRLEREAERIEADFHAGKLDHEFGEFVLRKYANRPNNVAGVCQERFDAAVFIRLDGTLEIATELDEAGSRNTRYVPLSEVAIGQAFREEDGPECYEFKAEKLEEFVND